MKLALFSALLVFGSVLVSAAPMLNTQQTQGYPEFNAELPYVQQPLPYDPSLTTNYELKLEQPLTTDFQQNPDCDEAIEQSSQTSFNAQQAKQKASQAMATAQQKSQQAKSASRQAQQLEAQAQRLNQRALLEQRRAQQFQSHAQQAEEQAKAAQSSAQILHAHSTAQQAARQAAAYASKASFAQQKAAREAEMAQQAADKAQLDAEQAERQAQEAEQNLSSMQITEQTEPCIEEPVEEPVEEPCEPETNNNQEIVVKKTIVRQKAIKAPVVTEVVDNTAQLEQQRRVAEFERQQINYSNAMARARSEAYANRVKAQASLARAHSFLARKQAEYTVKSRVANAREIAEQNVQDHAEEARAEAKQAEESLQQAQEEFASAQQDYSQAMALAANPTVDPSLIPGADCDEVIKKETIVIAQPEEPCDQH